MCSSSLLQLICKYIMLLIFLCGCLVGLLIFDSYLKTFYAKTNPAD